MDNVVLGTDAAPRYEWHEVIGPDGKPTVERVLVTGGGAALSQGQGHPLNSLLSRTRARLFRKRKLTQMPLFLLPDDDSDAGEDCPDEMEDDEDEDEETRIVLKNALKRAQVEGERRLNWE